MDFISDVAERIEQVIDEKVAKGQPKNDVVTAKVVSEDVDGVVWVQFEGAEGTTPVTSTAVSVEPGDYVNVRIDEGGRASILQNYTNPSAGTQEVETAQVTADDAQELASKAEADASVAHEAAESAMASALVASQAADSASVAAEVADGKAVQAQESADAAGNSAIQANGYAIGALAGLSDVEKVVGTLNWIAEHGTYFATDDAVVEPGKQYYVFDGGVYQPVQNPSDSGIFSYALTSDSEIDPEKTYYIRVVDYNYVKTQDVEIDESKTYYVYDDTEEDYVVVEDPDVEDISEYFERIERVRYEEVLEPDASELETYYERTVLYYELSVENSIQNYIASHVSITDDGLNLTADSNAYRAVLGTQGLKIIDPQGDVVGLHGETVQLGRTNGIYFEASANRLSFKTSSEDICWFGQDSNGLWEMHIQNTYVEDMMRFGNYAFIKRANGNMSLKWIDDSSQYDDVVFEEQ